MLAGSAGGSVKMRNKRHRNNFIKVDGFIEYGKKRIFVVIKFILAIGKNICQRKLFVCYHIGTTPLLVDMVNCYWISQFYHKPVRSCFILLKKESCIYAGSGVSQTPIKDLDERIEMQTSSTDCGSTWSARYGYENNIIKRLELMERLGFSAEEIREYRRQHWRFSVVRELEIQENPNNGNLDGAIRIL